MSGAKELRIFTIGLILLLGTGGASPLLTHPQQQDSALTEAIYPRWQPGDRQIEFGNYLVVLGGASRTAYTYLNYPIANTFGCLLSFVPAGQGLVSDICIGAPYLRLRGIKEPVKYTQVEQVEEGIPEGITTFRVQGNLSGPRGEKAQVVTTYHFHAESGLIELESEITNSGDQPIERFSYSLFCGANTSYSFSPFNRDAYPSLNFRVYGCPGYVLAWINRNPLDEKPTSELNPGESLRVAYALMVDKEGSNLLDRVYQELGQPMLKASIKLEEFKGDLAEIIIRDLVTHVVFYRTFFQGEEISEIPLPAGAYQVRANLFPGVRWENFYVVPDKPNLCTVKDSAKGQVKVRIRDGSGNPVPGKVTFLGVGGTLNPYFQPENPLVTGRGWETRKNSCFPGLGESAVSLPVGSYLVIASRGPEYSRDQRIVEILRNDDRRLDFTIDKVVDTRGFISIDTHMHTMFSDGDMKVPARVLSVAAEGVDIAVSADHNTIIDYRPALTELGLSGVLGFIPGDEVTIGGMIHYNTYPLTYRENLPLHGAINPHAALVKTLFERSRKTEPGCLIQVNHPRSGTIGYFNQYGLDPETAAYALKGFDLSFDVLEVTNGPYRHGNNADSLKDWLNLINRGHYFPLIGTSDSHGIDGSEPGYSRTYLKYSGGKGQDLNVAAVIRTLKAGHSFVTNGPLVEVTVNGSTGMGETCTDRDGEVEVAVRVQSAPWIAVNEIRLLVNGRRQMGLPVIPPKSGSLDLVKKFQIKLEQDAALVVEVLGHRTLYPLIQRTASQGRTDRAVLPYALTNPIFVDRDGNKRFDPPLPTEIRLLDKLPEIEKKEN